MKKLILVAIMALMVSPVLALPMLPDGTDAYWAINDTTGQADAKIIFENTGTGYTFGLFDKNNIANKLEMFLATDGQGDTALVKIYGNAGGIQLYSADTDAPPTIPAVGTATFAGNAFGFYLTTPQGATFYSDTLLNPSQIDHMTAGILIPRSEYQLSWEGVVVNVESVGPIPEPATLSLLGLGALSLLRKHSRKWDGYS
jgi:hypothetical protein